MMVHKAQASPKTVVFPEGDHEKILRACHTLVEENIAVPILLDNAEAIHKKIPELGLDLRGVRIVDPARRRCETATYRSCFDCGSGAA
jgi:malate dehydrogenase (oxaloacetate-decarboxylating)(NADP+)